MHCRVDIVVTAAAAGQYGAFEETSESDIHEMLSIIIRSAHLCDGLEVATMQLYAAGLDGGVQSVAGAHIQMKG